MAGVLAIDPGKNTGIAKFEGEDLVWCDLVKCSKAEGYCKYTRKILQILSYFSPFTVVIERPQIYPQRQQKGDPNDLIDVAILAGICIGAAQDCAVDLVKPHAWKGSRPKTVDVNYTKSLLSLAEKRILEKCDCRKSELHNVIDAVGIGLWKLGRR